jgi:putative DNA methylase
MRLRGSTDRWGRYSRPVLETRFDDCLIGGLASAEKQIQQNFRPVIAVHKWFARRPGALFRGLLLAEFDDRPLGQSYFESHDLAGVVLDPFMGGGTTLFEANRLGLSVVGYDTNPLSRWVCERELEALDVEAFEEAAEEIAGAVESEVGDLYKTRCEECGGEAKVKFFLWVKTHVCACGEETLLFPGPLVAGRGMKRHTHDVLICGECRRVEQYLPDEAPLNCPHCGRAYDSHFSRTASCRSCGTEFATTPKAAEAPPKHTLFALEYHCAACKGRAGRRGRFFKGADAADQAQVKEARRRYAALGSSRFWPDDPIPSGDETNRLLRWGYRRFSELHNERQLLGLDLIARRIVEQPEELKRALATVFSDFIRYQNLVCRYDAAALKVLDVFSIHGYPIHRVQCEAALVGIPKVGSGGWRHFAAKYAGAKRYCQAPFEATGRGRTKKVIPATGERIEARFVATTAKLKSKRAALLRASSLSVETLPKESVDLVATDPPYYANVAYSELLDFNYAWLRRLVPETPYFSEETSRHKDEVTGGKVNGRGLDVYAARLSAVYQAAARALKPGQPFVFTFHHNDLKAYAAPVVAVLDAGLVPTRTIGCPAEMRGSIHIAKSDSSRLDTVFVLRRPPAALPTHHDLAALLAEQVAHLERAGLHLTGGDLRCLAYGLMAEATVRTLKDGWQTKRPIGERLAIVVEELERRSEAIRAPVAALEKGEDGAASVMPHQLALDDAFVA